MKNYSQKMLKKITFVLLLLAGSTTANSLVNGTRSVRLLGATQLTREQLDNNYKGSASIAILYTYGFTVGAIIEKDKILVTNVGAIGFISTKVSGLMLNADAEDDGENYPTQKDPGTTPVPGRTLSTVTFGPLSANTKGVIATLPPPGSLPPPPGTPECVVYTYGSSSLTADYDNYKLSYLPLTIVEMSKCTSKYGPKDDKLYFCASAKSPSGTEPGCSFPDNFRVAMCPGNSFSKSYEGKVWCKKGRFLWWWWWCQEEEVSEPGWIVTGLSIDPSGDQHCDANSEFIMLFDYTNI